MTRPRASDDTLPGRTATDPAAVDVTEGGMDPQRVPVIGAGPDAPTGTAGAPSDADRRVRGDGDGAAPTGGGRPPLQRDLDAAMIGGVAAGVARTLGLEVALVRVGFVLLALALDGVGILAYLAAWALIPARAPALGAPPARRPGVGVWVGAALVALGAFLALESLADIRGWTVWRPWRWLGGELVLPIGLVIVGALLWWRGGSAAAPPSAPVLARPSEAARIRGEESRLTPLVLGLALVCLGGLWALDAAGATAVGATRIAGTTLLVLATGLVVGAFAGRARGLLLPGAILALVVVTLLGAARDGAALPPGASVLERPTSLTELPTRGYTWSAGDVVLDLRALDAATLVEAGGRAFVTAELGVGTLEVRVPDGITIEATANVGIGTLEVPSEVGLTGEVGIGRLIAPGSDQRGLGLSRELLPPDRAAVIVLRLDVGVGRILITR